MSPTPRRVGETPNLRQLDSGSDSRREHRKCSPIYATATPPPAGGGRTRRGKGAIYRDWISPANRSRA